MANHSPFTLYHRDNTNQGNLMTEIDANGVFWDGEAPEHQVPGRLQFDPHKGIELTLTGAFDEAPHTDSTSGVTIPARQIHGVAGDNVFTLVGCGQSNYQFRFPGVFRTQTFRAQALLKGIHLAPSDIAGMTSIAIQSRHLAQWTKYSKAVDDWDYDEQTGRLTEYRLSYRPPLDERVATPIGEFRSDLRFRYLAQRPVMRSSTMGAR